MARTAQMVLRRMDALSVLKERASPPSWPRVHSPTLRLDLEDHDPSNLLDMALFRSKEPDLQGRTDAEITATLSWVNASIEAINQQLYDDEVGAVPRGSEWRSKATIARSNHRRVANLLHSEWKRRYPPQKPPMSDKVAQARLKTQQLANANHEAARAAKLERARLHAERSDFNNRTQAELFVQTVRSLVSAEQFREFWKQTKERFQGHPCWDDAPGRATASE